jgi:hypothetical protein
MLTVMHEELNRLVADNRPLLLESNDFPLLNNTYASGLGIPELQQLNNEIPKVILVELGEYTSFKNVSTKDIVNLRLLLHHNYSDEVMMKWCNNLLRYIEIRYRYLRSNEKKFERPKDEGVQIFNQILALFVEYYISKNDLIYLNTALKILDLEWIDATTSKSTTVKVLSFIKKTQIDCILRNIENE